MNRPNRTPSPRNWPYDTERWRRLRLEIIEARGGRCEECGAHDGNATLEVHHAVPLTKADRLAKDAARGFPHPVHLQLLCKSCHGQITRGVSKPERKRRRSWRAFIDSFRGG